MQKVYVAARAKYRAAEIATIQNKLKLMGYEIAYDWPAGDTNIKKPYRQPANRQHNLKAQEQMLRAAAQADIFILIDDPGLRGAYIEFGAFLKDCLDRPKGRKAFIVGPDSIEREHVFESPGFVYFVDTVEGLYKNLVK